MPAPSQYLDTLLGQAATFVTEAGGCEVVWHQWSSERDGARPLLLVHGGFGSWTHWALNIEALSKDFVVWTIDLPGLGSSGDLPRPCSLEDIAQLVLKGWCELQGRESAFDVAGFSFGGMVAGQMAAMAGQRCKRCLLIGAVGFGQLQVQVQLVPPPGPRVDTVGAASIHRDNIARLMLHDPARIDPLAVHIHGDNLARARFNSRRLAMTNALAEALPHVEAKLVGIWGEWDATAGGAANLAARRELFRRAQPGAEFHVVPGAGHWVMYESPQRLNQLIIEA